MSVFIGKSFHSCGCNGPGYIPKNPLDYEAYLNKVLRDYEDAISQLQNQSLETCNDKLERITFWSERVALVRNELSGL